jgi:hypothetical protein
MPTAKVKPQIVLAPRGAQEGNRLMVCAFLWPSESNTRSLCREPTSRGPSQA